MIFRDLNRRHAGATCWIFGTGPGLDRFIEAAPTIGDGIVIAIHRAIGVAPVPRGRTYWQVLDDAWGLGVPGPWDVWLDEVCSDDAETRLGGGRVTGLFRDPLYHGAGPHTPAPVHPHIVRFSARRKRDHRVLGYPHDVVAQYGHLYTFCGSGCTAVHAAWYLGAVRCRLVGLDGGDGYARCLAQWYDRPGRGGAGYVVARCALEECAESLDINIEDG